MNEWVYAKVNIGVYRTGFATMQQAYESNLLSLFESLDRLEEHLGKPGHSPYAFGEYVTEADIRLYIRLIRFHVAYYNIFKCNLKMIRHDYPRLEKWLRTLYWVESDRTNGGVFKKTTFFDVMRIYVFNIATSTDGFISVQNRIHGHIGTRKGNIVVPRAPVPDILPPVA
jgi:glutathionyl-hydroquinone reductase